MDTFGPLYAAADLAQFLAETYSEAAVSRELGAPDRLLRVAEENGELVGFCKLGLTTTLPVHLGERRVLELKQLYVRRTHHGTAVARDLMAWVLEEAGRRGYDDVVLSVYCDNARAQRFYRRYGFEHVGDHFFMVGAHRDDEWLLRLRLTPRACALLG